MKLRSTHKIQEDELITKTKSSSTYGTITEHFIKELADIMFSRGMIDNSVFCDVGSGFGNIVMSISLMHDVSTIGIEIS